MPAAKGSSAVSVDFRSLNDPMPRVTVYPLAGLAARWQDEPFDESQLPATIVPGVTIENVAPMFRDDTWNLFCVGSA
jgi:hypothetical protein